jgi:hypothetical protein
MWRAYLLRRSGKQFDHPAHQIALQEMVEALGSTIFPDEATKKVLMEFVFVRHDCVHRYGRDHDGSEHTISKAALEKLGGLSKTWSLTLRHCSLGGVQTREALVGACIATSGNRWLREVKMWGAENMSIHTVVVDGPLALRMQRLAAAREGAIGRQILTLPLLAARLAGGFIAPASQEILYPAIRAALDAGVYEDIGQVSGLPGMPSAVLTSLRSRWDAGILTGIADNPRLRDFTMLERRVREALPPGTLAPPDLVEAVLKRLHHAPKLLGSVTLHEVPDIKPIWHQLIVQLCDVVPVRWVASAHCQRSWFLGKAEALPAGRSLLAAADVCADPRSEVREALRWARALIA